MSFIKLLDENLYIKKEKTLRRYFIKSYKYLIFEVMPKLMLDGKIDGVYELELPIDDLFKKVYGSMILKFSVKNDIAIIEDIIPNDILIEAYMKNLPCYHGIPYASEKDLKKIKIMERLI